jgi:hypothetical protein
MHTFGASGHGSGALSRQRQTDLHAALPSQQSSSDEHMSYEQVASEFVVKPICAQLHLPFAPASQSESL